MDVDESDRTPLHWAASRNEIAKVKELLLDPKVDIDAQDDSGWTPLMIVVSAGHREIVELLIGKNADVNLTNNNGQTPLHYAASKNHFEIAQVLIKKGASINTRDRLMQTPLHRCASKGIQRMVELFLSAPKININPQDSLGNTPAHLAAEEERLDIVKMLAKAGADLSIENKEKKTVFNVSENHSFNKVLKNALLTKALDDGDNK